MHSFRVLGDWLDDRTGYRGSIRTLLEAPADADSVVMHALATAVATCFAVLVLSGIVLMTAYSPSPQTAWASVHFVEFIEPYGWILRGLHFWAAQALFIFAGAHVLYGALVASYRPPHEIGWWLTLVVLGLAIAQGITGGLLPWDQRGWWARIVEGNIVGLAPVVGGWIEQMICGGPELGALGLTRAYAAHVLLLPLLITVVLALRLRLRRREMTPSDSLWIEQAGRGVLVAIVLLCALFGLTRWAHGAPLDAPADPLSDYPARPEWFLMSLYELRKFFHGSWEFWGTTLIPGAAGAYLALLPWIDRPGRSRAAVLMPVVLIFGGAIGLGAAAYAHDRKDAHYAKARQKADLFAGAAAELAMKGVPPGGPLEMLHRDPELRGRDLFEKHCANCHVMEGLGDPEKATASKLDGWGTRKWIEAMVHDPDAPEFFGRGAYQGQMPSVDQRPTDPNKAEGWVAMVKSPAERQALALFLEAQGAEPNDDPPHAPYDRAALALGEKIVSERCTTCHLYKGEGDDGGTEISPELAHYGSLAWTTTQVQDPSSPKNYRLKALDSRFKGHMPRFERELSPADVDIVSRWTRAHARGLKLH